MASGASCDANLNNVPDECEYQIPGNVLLVEDDAPAGGDGLTWCTAYQSLQDAIAASVAGDTIWVAQGTYLPVNCAPTCGPGDRTATFNLKNGVTIQGGYAGLGAPVPNARDMSAYETILSGDLHGDDVGFTNNVENAFHVVTATNLSATTVLDGVTIKHGNAKTAGNRNGAGMLINGGLPTVTNCTFTWNSATEFVSTGGGGIFISASAATIRQCKFAINRGGRGGGMQIFGSLAGQGSPKILTCTFVSNQANLGGGNSFGAGVYVISSSPEFTNCGFYGNGDRMQTEGGGGICNAMEADSIITNCVFSNNEAYRGAGIGNRLNSNGTVTNCTFSANRSTGEGAGFYNNASSPTLTNCILWGNSTVDPATTQDQNFKNTGNPEATVNNSCIEGLTSTNLGINNIDDDPRFRDRSGPDNIPGTPDDNMRLSQGFGLCPNGGIDSGDNALLPVDIHDLDNDGDTTEPVPDLDLAPRIVNVTVDMGPYEYTAVCGQNGCEPGESQCSCPGDCGTPPGTETLCGDGVDNDCDCSTDCDDSDCAGDPACGPPPPPE